MKKQNPSKNSFHTIFAMQTISLILLYAINIFPQIEITERIEINPDEQNVGEDFMVLNNSSLAMLKTGLLKVKYSFIKHYNVELPDYSLFKVKFLKNNVSITDSVKPRFPNFSWWSDYMYNHCDSIYETREGYNYVLGPYVELGSVVEGDTVQFTYYSDDVETRQPIEYDIYSATQNGTSWSVKFGNYNNCLLDFDHLLMGSFYVHDEIETIYASIDPGVLYPGDTAQVVIKRRLPGGILEDYPPEQTFEVGMLEGCILGNILVGDSLDSYFYDITQPIKFIADSTGDSTGVVLLSIGLVDTSGTTKFNKISDALTQYCFDGGPINEYETVFAEVKEEPMILLGEMKFYGVKKKTVNGALTEIKIEEIEVAQDATPVFPSLTGNWSWIQDSTIWSGRPINIETKGQSPIFYDKFYAQVYYNGKTKPVINNLPQGMIRVIGRYLGKTPDNKVKLFTTQYQSAFIDTLEIQVIRPNKLRRRYIKYNWANKN